MRRLREAICKKRPNLWKDNSWFKHIVYRSEITLKEIKENSPDYLDIVSIIYVCETSRPESVK